MIIDHRGFAAIDIYIYTHTYTSPHNNQQLGYKYQKRNKSSLGYKKYNEGQYGDQHLPWLEILNCDGVRSKSNLINI